MTDTPTRAWRGVLAKIEGDLLSGVLTPGDHLPPERELAAELGVGRSSVREALRVLEVLGLIRTATGSGPHAGAIVIATPHGGMSALLRLQVAAQGFAIEDVVATRLILEGAVVQSLAAACAAARHTHPTEDDAGVPGAAPTAEGPALTAAEAALDAMDETSLTAEEFLALDAQFHLALAEASGNAVVAAMMAGLRTSIEQYVVAGAARLDDWDQTAERLRTQHREILGAITLGDPARAQRLVADHITGYHAHAGLARH